MGAIVSIMELSMPENNFNEPIWPMYCWKLLRNLPACFLWGAVTFEDKCYAPFSTIHISSRFWLLKQLTNAYCYVYVFICTFICFNLYFYEMAYLDCLTVGHDTVGLSPLETNAQDIRRVSPMIVMNTVTTKYQLYTFFESCLLCISYVA